MLIILLRLARWQVRERSGRFESNGRSATGTFSRFSTDGRGHSRSSDPSICCWTNGPVAGVIDWICRARRCRSSVLFVHVRSLVRCCLDLRRIRIVSRPVTSHWRGRFCNENSPRLAVISKNPKPFWKPYWRIRYQCYLATFKLSSFTTYWNYTLTSFIRLQRRRKEERKSSR